LQYSSALELVDDKRETHHEQTNVARLPGHNEDIPTNMKETPMAIFRRSAIHRLRHFPLSAA
jgi:hypothetical protein